MKALWALIAISLIAIIAVSYFREDDVSLNVFGVIPSDDLGFLFDKEILKIDTRSKAAYDDFHVFESVNITLKDVQSEPSKVKAILNKWKGHKIVIYCYGSKCDISENVAEYLVYGDNQIFVYNEGWEMFENLVKSSGIGAKTEKLESTTECQIQK